MKPTPEEITQELRDISASVQELFPDTSVLLTVGKDDYISIGIHQVKTYAEATEIFRKCGVQRRTKQTWTDPNPRTVLSGFIADTITLDVFCDDLSPTCRVEKVTEKIPKQETRDTGEFIEVERVRIVCGEKETEAA